MTYQQPRSVGGRYEILSVIRKSHMSTVSLGIDTLKSSNVIIKVLNTDTADGEAGKEMLARFKQEARIYGSLNHPNIVSVLDVHVVSGSPCIIMEFVEGQTLGGIIMQWHKFNLGSRVALLQQIFAAVDYAHSRGVWHRDLKPGNIMVTPAWEVKVLDFGIAKMRGYEAMTKTSGTCLSPMYCSPEQIDGARHQDKSCDLFALGILAYQLLTGHHPFPGSSPNQVMCNIRAGYRIAAPTEETLPLHQKAFRACFEKALNPDPQKRWASADHFFEELLNTIRLQGKPRITTKGHFRYPSHRLVCLDELDEARHIKWDLWKMDLNHHLEATIPDQLPKPQSNEHQKDLNKRNLGAG